MGIGLDDGNVKTNEAFQNNTRRLHRFKNMMGLFYRSEERRVGKEC